MSAKTPKRRGTTGGVAPAASRSKPRPKRARATDLAAKYVPLAALRAHPRNPRTISAERLEQLKRMLVADPEMLEARPLIALPNGTVIAGNQRLRAASELGWETIPVVTVDLDEHRAIEWALRDNNPMGEDVEEISGALIAELQAAGRDADLTGYASQAIDRLLRAATPAPPVDPDDVPPLPKKPRSKRGEVYELGSHRLMCGDATASADVATLLSGVDRVELVFTSPPYLDLRHYHGDQDQELEKLAAFLPTWKDQATLLAVNLGLVVRRHAVVRYWETYIAAAEAVGLKLIAWNVWNREDATNLGHQALTFPTWHEFVLVFGARQRRPNRILPTTGARRKPIGQRQPDGSITGGTAQVHSHKALGSVLTLPSHKGAGPDHPAVFPVGLPEAYIVAVTERGDVIADPFAGAGTTLIAAEMTGRRCFAMEIDPAYCDVIRERYEAFVGAQAAA